MAVNQIWFIDTPLVEDNPTDLPQIAIGFSFPSATGFITDYVRRYLNDNEVVATTGPVRSTDTEVDGEYNRYYRRYLNDKINNIPED